MFIRPSGSSSEISLAEFDVHPWQDAGGALFMPFIKAPEVTLRA